MRIAVFFLRGVGLVAIPSPFYRRLRVVRGTLLGSLLVLGPRTPVRIHFALQSRDTWVASRFFFQVARDVKKKKKDDEALVAKKRSREFLYHRAYTYSARFCLTFFLQDDIHGDRIERRHVSTYIYRSIPFFSPLPPESLRLRNARSNDMISRIFPRKTRGWSGWPLLLLKGRLISLKFLKVGSSV